MFESNDFSKQAQFFGVPDWHCLWPKMKMWSLSGRNPFAVLASMLNDLTNGVPTPQCRQPGPENAFDVTAMLLFQEHWEAATLEARRLAARAALAGIDIISPDATLIEASKRVEAICDRVSLWVLSHETTADVITPFEEVHALRPTVRRLRELVMLTDQVHQMPKEPAPAPEPIREVPASRGKNVEGRMLKLWHQNQHDAVHWSAEEWANRLGCRPSSVKETKVWKEIIRVQRATLAADGKIKVKKSQRIGPKSG